MQSKIKASAVCILGAACMMCPPEPVQVDCWLRWGPTSSTTAAKLPEFCIESDDKRNVFHLVKELLRSLKEPMSDPVPRGQSPEVVRVVQHDLNRCMKDIVEVLRLSYRPIGYACELTIREDPRGSIRRYLVKAWDQDGASRSCSVICEDRPVPYSDSGVHFGFDVFLVQG